MCLTTAGKLVWEKELKDEYKIAAPTWGFTSHPLVDDQNVYCVAGGDGSKPLVALDKTTGAERWKRYRQRAGLLPAETRYGWPRAATHHLDG